MEGRCIEHLPVEGCRPAADVLGIDVVQVKCDSCPFPFCVVSEAQIIKRELREHMTRIMKQLNNTVDEIALTVNTSKRSIYRYMSGWAKNRGECKWCGLVHSQMLMCKSNMYCVVKVDGQYIILLNHHKSANPMESNSVNFFTEYAFPNSSVQRFNGGHDRWLITHTDDEDSARFERMCDALNTYTMSLGRVGVPV